MIFGTHIEDAMRQVEGKTEAIRRGKAENVMRKYIGLPQKFASISGGRNARV